MLNNLFVLAVSAIATSSLCTAAHIDGYWNWSENIQFSTSEISRPKHEGELADLVRYSPSPVKVVGTAHSFNDIADTDGFHVSLVNFKWSKIDKENRTVTFGAGFTYSALLKVLQAENMAIANLPSLPHINVAGSVVTGTHGSGVNN